MLLLGLSGVSISAFPSQRAWLDHSVVIVLLLEFIIMTTLAAAAVAYRSDLLACEKSQQLNLTKGGIRADKVELASSDLILKI